jgi:Protein of unknown function (DUF2808)
MRFPSWFSLAIAITFGGILLHDFSPMPAQAVQLQDGKVYFVQPPSLVSAATTERRASSSGASYYFTLNVPADAGEPLQQVEIAQRDGSIQARLVQFDAEDSRAFVGTRRDRGDDLSLGETTFNRDTQTLSVVFDPPVPPGTTVTLKLQPKRNPRRDGIYLFGVTAYPAGADAHGQFLGYGRLQFDGSDHSSPFLE